MADWYVGQAQYTAVVQWAALTVYVVGDIRRPLTTQVAVNNSNARVFRCTTAGVSGAGNPTWVNTAGATTSDGTVVWTEITGQAAYGWSAAHNRLPQVLGAGWAAAGDRVWVSHNHSYSTATANHTLTSQGTIGAPVTVRCVNAAGSVPPVSADLRTTALEAITGVTTVAIAGYLDMDGVEFRAGSGSSAAALNVATGAVAGVVRLGPGTKLTLQGTGASSMALGGANTAIHQGLYLDGVIFKFGAVGQILNVRKSIWRGCSIDAAGSAPTTLISVLTAPGTGPVIEGMDLSFLGSGKTLFSQSSGCGEALLLNCKVNAAVIISATQRSATVLAINCDSGAGVSRNEKHTAYGDLTTELTVIRAGGATDGATPVAWKMVTTADTAPRYPLEAFPISFWNETLASITVDLQGIWDGGAVPTNDDIWMDVDYLGDAASPLATILRGEKVDVLAAASNQAAGSGTWGGSTTKFKLSATFTPAQKGPVMLYVRCGKASDTFYVDPRPVVSGVVFQRSRMLMPGVYNNDLARAPRGVAGDWRIAA